MEICKKTLETLYSEYDNDELQLPAELQLANLECSYQMNFQNEHAICMRIESILHQTKTLDNKLAAKMFLKLGNWMRQKVINLPTHHAAPPTPITLSNPARPPLPSRRRKS